MEHQSAVAQVVILIAALLLTAAATLGVSRLVRLPFTVLLVLVGIGLANLDRLIPGVAGLFDFHISPDLILYVFLPTLIFESAFQLDARHLRDNLAPILLLAIPGLLLSTLVIAAIVGLFTPIPFLAALVLGAILSATDPVAVIALFRQLGAPERLTVLVEGESLFNDATAIVAAQILLGIALVGVASLDTLGQGVLHFLLVFFGGALVGWVLALMTGWILGVVDADPAIEISLLTVLAYMSFLVGEEMLHVSGVMATVAAGLTMGGWGRSKISPSVRAYIDHFWEFMAYVANALIFLMVGLAMDLPALGDAVALLVWVLLGMLISRALVVFGLVPLLGALPNYDPIDWRYRTVMFWGGLRGAVALAVVLSLGEFAYAEQFVALVTGAVLFTLVVKGLTVEPLMRLLGLDHPSVPDQLARKSGLLEATLAAMARIPELRANGLFSLRIAGELETRYRQEIALLRLEITELRQRHLDSLEEQRLLALQLLTEEKAAYFDMFAKHHLREEAFRLLDHRVSGQIDALRHGGDLTDNGSEGSWIRRLEEPLNRLLQWLLTPTPLGESMRLTRAAREYEVSWGRYQANARVLDHLGAMAAEETLALTVIEQVRGRYARLQEGLRARIDGWAEQFPEFVAGMQERLAERLVLQAERDGIEEEVRSGSIPAGVGEEMIAEIDQRIRRLRGVAAPALRVDPQELLRKVPFFSEAESDDYVRLLARLRPITAPPDKVIVRQGEQGRSLYLIARGVVRVSRQQKGHQSDLASLMAGDFFGEMGLLFGEPRTATCRAVTPCALYELTKEGLEEALQVCPAMREALAKAAAERSAVFAAG